MAQGETDVIEPLHQAPSGVIIDLKTDRLVCITHLAGLKIDRYFSAGITFNGFSDCFDIALWQDNREEATLEGVTAKNVGEAARDDRSEAVILQRPNSMLAR